MEERGSIGIIIIVALFIVLGILLTLLLFLPEQTSETQTNPAEGFSMNAPFLIEAGTVNPDRVVFAVTNTDPDDYVIDFINIAACDNNGVETDIPIDPQETLVIEYPCDTGNLQVGDEISNSLF